ncbi:MAG: helix-turn-helix transcriptional regulator [bacterium]|nr:helix-turn-helix transcriptional regulator [bacterium]
MRGRSKEMLRDVGLKLRNLRRELDFTKKEMAKRCGVDTSTYYRNESGSAFPSARTLRLLCHEYDISMDWLLFNKGPMRFKQKEPGTKPRKEPEVVVKTITVPMELPGDVEELFDHMKGIPLLHYEILTHFHKFKVENEGLVKSSMVREQKKENS